MSEACLSTTLSNYWETMSYIHKNRQNTEVFEIIILNEQIYSSQSPYMIAVVTVPIISWSSPLCTDGIHAFYFSPLTHTLLLSSFVLPHPLFPFPFPSFLSLPLSLFIFPLSSLLPYFAFLLPFIVQDLANWIGKRYAPLLPFPLTAGLWTNHSCVSLYSFPFDQLHMFESTSCNFNVTSNNPNRNFVQSILRLRKEGTLLGKSFLEQYHQGATLQIATFWRTTF